MKLKEYLDALNEIVKENPKALEFEVISSIDEEGNGYNEVFYTPSSGTYNEGEFATATNKNEHNSICIN